MDAVLSELDSRLALDRVLLNTVAHCGESQGDDAWVMLPRPPAGRLELVEQICLVLLNVIDRRLTLQVFLYNIFSGLFTKWKLFRKYSICARLGLGIRLPEN